MGVEPEPMRYIIEEYATVHSSEIIEVISKARKETEFVFS